MTYPYEDVDIAQMRAEMLHKAQNSAYDDGAYLLGQNPDLMQVGLFGRAPKPTKPVAPVDLGRRRAFGLSETPMSMPATGESANAMVPVPQPMSPQQPATPIAPAQSSPQQPAPQQPSNPLGQMANKALNEPVSRRTVLKRAGSAALQQALPTPSAADVVKEIASPLTKSAIDAFVRNPTIDEYIQSYVRNMLNEAAVSEPFAAISSMYTFMRDYLPKYVSEAELRKYDKLHERVEKHYDNGDEGNDKAIAQNEQLANFVYDKLKLLKPNELYDVHSNLYQNDPGTEGFFNYIAETPWGFGIDDDTVVGKKAFMDYMNKAFKQDNSPKD